MSKANPTNAASQLGCAQVALCLVAPPLAVLERGCMTIIAVTLLTMFGWIPGVIAAFYVNSTMPTQRRYIRIPASAPIDEDLNDENAEPQREYIRLADGEWLEIVDEEISADGYDDLDKHIGRHKT